MTEHIRTLTAIMFTDIVGYTPLMEKDEAKAIQVRENHRALVRMPVEPLQGVGRKQKEIDRLKLSSKAVRWPSSAVSYKP